MKKFLLDLICLFSLHQWKYTRTGYSCIRECEHCEKSQVLNSGNAKFVTITKAKLFK
jgi:hypothetical protein